MGIGDCCVRLLLIPFRQRVSTPFRLRYTSSDRHGRGSDAVMASPGVTPTAVFGIGRVFVTTLHPGATAIRVFEDSGAFH